jgi:hypothetical protein
MMTNEQKDAIKVLFARKNAGATCTDKAAEFIYSHLDGLGDLDSLEGVILDEGSGDKE